MRKRTLTINNGIPQGLSNEFGDFTVTMLSQTVTHPLQCNIADYFSRTSGGDPCCRSCGELNKQNLVLFGENIHCFRCSNEMKNFYMESFYQKEEMREQALRAQRELEMQRSPTHKPKNIVIQQKSSTVQASDENQQKELSTTRTSRSRGYSSILALPPNSRGASRESSSEYSSSPLCSPCGGAGASSGTVLKY